MVASQLEGLPVTASGDIAAYRLRCQCHVWVVAAGADPGIWVVSAWSFHTIHFWPTGYASSSVPRISLRIHHNRLGSMEVIAIPLVCCLSDLSASRAHAVVRSVSWS